MNRSMADLGLADTLLGVVPGAAPFAGFVGGVLGVLGSGFAHSDPLLSPIIP